MILSYPEELPVSHERERIIAAFKRRGAVIVCGDTGSGKTTQLPKMALEAGCGAKNRRIACTQPRRLAAVAMAERVAGETATPLGELIGFRHRYDRKISSATRIEFMTDGVLLAETRNDPLLRAYDAIIVDEAHERSLNIDFLLGILKRIMQRRRDLLVIISSATLDSARFAEFFNMAPIITVAGRLYPIDLRYQPPAEHEELDLPAEIATAVQSLPANGDILVFLPGERDIRETAEYLRAVRTGEEEIIPLLASLPASEQRRAFTLSSRRRIVIATNVAETSVTIPGIRYVIDSGLARVARYLHKTHVQRLQIEPISRASANQRTGRCGRLGPGICIRLYSEEDFAAREEFTAPEILRSSLAGVILTMIDLRMGDIVKFPFLDPPKSTAITEGLRELIELGAVEHNENHIKLTEIGRRLARLPVEPRLARILLSAVDFGVLSSVLPVVAAMSCEEPRRRPADDAERTRANQAQAKFRVEGSDFLGTLKLWQWWEKQNAELSQSKLRKLCRETYLAYPKMREWFEQCRQLQRLMQRNGATKLESDADFSADVFHRALLPGLLGRIGHFDRENREYRGARGLRFAIHPASILKKQLPEWIVAGELIDTSRLFAANAAGIDQRWIEAAAGAIAKHHYHSPEWDADHGFVRATEQVTLYGLVIVEARRCDYSRIDPQFAREIFIRRGLIDGEFPKPSPPVRHNLSLLAELKSEAEKRRCQDLVDETALFQQFDRAIPPEICSAPALNKWLSAAGEAELRAFRLNRKQLFKQLNEKSGDFPDFIRIGDIQLKLEYRHLPDEPERDGLTCRVRRSQANVLRMWRADYLVPGMLPEKLTWMLSVLPTAQRKVLAPISEKVECLLPLLKPDTLSLAENVVKLVNEQWGFRINPECWTRCKIPEHLLVRFVIIDDESRRVIADSRNLESALAAAGISARTASVPLSSKANQLFTTWPENANFTPVDSNLNTKYYPALHDEGNGVTLRLYTTQTEAEREHARGVARLYALAVAGRLRGGLTMRELSVAAKLFLKELNYTADAINADIVFGAILEALIRNRPLPYNFAQFEACLNENLQELVKKQTKIRELTASALNTATDLLNRLETDAKIPVAVAEAVQEQIIWLICRGFPCNTPFESLERYARYFKGITTRLDRARISPMADAAKEKRFAPFWQRYRDAIGKNRNHPDLEKFRWALEEFRISIFAQELRTAFPISEKRLNEMIMSVESRA